MRGRLQRVQRLWSSSKPLLHVLHSMFRAFSHSVLSPKFVAMHRDNMANSPLPRYQSPFRENQSCPSLCVHILYHYDPRFSHASRLTWTSKVFCNLSRPAVSLHTRRFFGPAWVKKWTYLGPVMQKWTWSGINHGRHVSHPVTPGSPKSNDQL